MPAKGRAQSWITAAIVVNLALSLGPGSQAGAQEPRPSSPEAVRAQATGDRRPRIAVQKWNDADRDGRFSRDEVGARPGAPVTFLVTITNVGATPVKIRSLSDSFGTTTLEVCPELIGRRIRPGRAAACTFTLQNYSPPRFDSRANTVGVGVKATISNRTTAAAAISTVTTNTSEAVRGRRVRRGDAGEDLAATGPRTAPLWALSLSLVATGWELLALARRRQRKHAPRSRRR